MFKKEIHLQLLPVERVMLFYLLITGIYILIFHNTLQKESFHLVFRIIATGIIFAFALFDKNFINIKLLRLIRNTFPFLLLVYVYKETDYLNNLLIADNLDYIIIQAESKIFSTLPSVAFSSLVPSDFFSELMYFGYFSYYVMITSIPLYIYFFVNRHQGEQAIFIIISSFLIYYLIFIILPVAGPQFYLSEYLDPMPHAYFFGPIVRYIQSFAESETAAFPSSHVSVCMMLIWISFLYARKFMVIILPVSVLLILSTVYIRAHYIIDVAGGILFTPLLYNLSLKLYPVLKHNYLLKKLPIYI